MEAVLDALQWPAMITTLIAAWLVGSERKSSRGVGFWCFVGSNVLWIAWAWHDHAHALVVLQLGLFFLNVRGLRKAAPGGAPG